MHFISNNSPPTGSVLHLELIALSAWSVGSEMAKFLECDFSV